MDWEIKIDEGSSELALPGVEGAITRARAKRIERDTENLLLLFATMAHNERGLLGGHRPDAVHTRDHRPDDVPGVDAHEEAYALGYDAGARLGREDGVSGHPSPSSVTCVTLSNLAF